MIQLGVVMSNFINVMESAKKSAIILLILTSVLFFESVAPVFAHGGEDHGDQKPQATTGDKGAVTRTARLGEYELTFKHQFLEPDTAVAAKLFVTKFKLTSRSDKAAAKIEIESVSNGSVTEATVEKIRNHRKLQRQNSRIAARRLHYPCEINL